MPPLRKPRDEKTRLIDARAFPSEGATVEEMGRDAELVEQRARDGRDGEAEGEGGGRAALGRRVEDDAVREGM